MKELIEIIKQIDIGRYTQTEYAEIVDEIVINFKAKWYDELLDKNGWRDYGGQS